MPKDKTTRVLMLINVADGKIDDGTFTLDDYDYLAGDEYDLPAEKADVFIVKGYAEGELSREYSDQEKGAIFGVVQAVKLGM